VTTRGIAANRAVKLVELPQTRHHDDFVVSLPVSAADVVCAQKAVIVHSAQEWPHGMLCLNCHAYHPCLVHRRGRQLLSAAGWGDDRIDSMICRARSGLLPWPVLSPGWRADRT
jgi:hypothetical protein